MTIEKPISTIRKAVHGAAEEMAVKEFLDKPQARHYERVFNVFKKIRDASPEMAEKLITINARAKEVKDELGPELDETFRMVYDEVEEKFKPKMVEAMEQIKKQNLNDKEYKKELVNLTARVFERMGSEVKKDPRITSAFSGKEELLDKTIKFYITNTVEIFNVLEIPELV